MHESLDDDVIVHCNSAGSDNILACRGGDGGTRSVVGRHKTLHSYSLVHIPGKSVPNGSSLSLVRSVVND